MTAAPRLLTQSEAYQLDAKIHAALNEAGKALLKMKAGEGWRALGFDNWTDYLQRNFSQSRKHLYELMNAAPVQERILEACYPKVTSVPVSHAALLARYPVEVQVPAYTAAVARYDNKVTESRLYAIAETFTQAAQTGYADVDGVPTALEAALSHEDDERQKRARDHADRRNGVEYLTSVTGSFARVNGRIEFVLPPDVALPIVEGEQYEVKIYRVLESEAV